MAVSCHRLVNGVDRIPLGLPNRSSAITAGGRALSGEPVVVIAAGQMP